MQENHLPKTALALNLQKSLCCNHRTVRERNDDEIRAASLRRLAELMPKESPLEPELTVKRGLPVDVILGEASKSAAGLIVLGLHRKSLLVPSGRLPSTTVYGVVIAAECPVLTVRT